MTKVSTLKNFVAGEWQRSSAGDYLDVVNPATGQAMTSVPLSPGAEVDVESLSRLARHTCR